MLFATRRLSATMVLAPYSCMARPHATRACLRESCDRYEENDLMKGDHVDEIGCTTVRKRRTILPYVSTVHRGDSLGAGRADSYN